MIRVMNENSVIVRPATVRDVPAIDRLITPFAERGIMLFRSHAELYESLREFVVAEDAGEVVGICALEIVWADLAEVRSLAVHPGRQGKGIGRKLVEAVVDEARRLEVQRLFTLTYEQAFFERLGFAVVDKSALPTKVWSVCIKCPKRHGCDEIAMVRTILDAPAVAEAASEEDGALRYDVPTPLMQVNVKREA
jgi:amino-acid N-acetyltransferase